jgi:hypothetical protein
MFSEGPLGDMNWIVTTKTERQHKPGCADLATNGLLEPHLAVRHASAIVHASIDKLGLLHVHLIHIFSNDRPEAEENT